MKQPNHVDPFLETARIKHMIYQAILVPPTLLKRGQQFVSVGVGFPLFMQPQGAV